MIYKTEKILKCKKMEPARLVFCLLDDMNN